MVQKHVLESIDDEKLRVYFVWLPILLSDDASAAEGMAAKQTDARTHLYWDPDMQLGAALGAALKLPHFPPATDEQKNGIAWDVYLLYPPGTTWGETPPVPVFWQHQLGGLPAANRLDGPGLAREIERRIHGT